MRQRSCRTGRARECGAPRATSPNRPAERIPELGLVCLSAGPEVRFRTITRTRYLALRRREQKTCLRELYVENLRRLFGALDFCAARNIRLYRASSTLFPMDDPLGDEVLEELRPQMARFGRAARQRGIRVVAHPDQFVVLNSATPAVVQQSVAILTRHARVFDLLGLPRSPWATLILHGGKSGRGAELLETIAALPPSARRRLVLENDESAYKAGQILELCGRAGVPMVFDSHHHLIAERLPDYDDPSIGAFVEAARSTWPDPAWQIVHISNGAAGLHDGRHNEFIEKVPSAYARVPWIEVEARGKELAIERLRATWAERDTRR